MTTNRNDPVGAWVYDLHEDANSHTIDWSQYEAASPNPTDFSAERFFRWRCWFDYGTGLAGDLLSHEYDAINQILDLGIPASAVAAVEYPDLVRQYRVTGVPKTVVNDRVEIVPVRLDRRGSEAVARRARLRNQGRYELRLLALGHVARVVHRRRPSRAAIARHVHREGIVARLGEKGHPARARRVEGHFGGRPRTVHEYDHAIVQAPGPERRPRQHALTYVELRELAFHRGRLGDDG